MTGYLVVFVVAALATYLLIFPVLGLAKRIGAVVQPDTRRVHERPTATIGGVAMVGGFLVAMLLAYVLPQFRSILHSSTEGLGVVLAAVVMAAVGFLDDLRDVSAPAKVAGQVLAASILTMFGATMFYFRVPFAGVVVLAPSIVPLLTALWVVAMANAINLIDGLDGLASGIVGIASLAFFVYSFKLVSLGSLSATSIGPLIAIVTLAVCVGFLPHNFHPARIFMGDTGALFLGLLMAAATSVVGGRTSDVSGETFFFFAPLFIPFVILGVPMVDMIFAIIRRTAKHTGVSSPDKAHLHHRLLQMGHGHRRSVLILWAWTVILSGFVLVPLFASQVNAFIPVGLAALAVMLFTLFQPAIRERTLAKPLPSFRSRGTASKGAHVRPRR